MARTDAAGIGAEPSAKPWWRAVAVAVAVAASTARRRAWAFPLLLVVAALTLSVPRLLTPDTYVFDELYYAYTAGRYVAGDPGAYSTAERPAEDVAIEWTHPPLAKLIIAAAILAVGDGPLGWRAASVLFGVAGVVVTFLLGRQLTGSAAVGLLGAGLLLVDGLYFVESRLGMSNLFLVVFNSAALLAVARALAGPAARAGPPLAATGLLLGLALATKWSTVALIGLVGVLLCWRGFGLLRAARGRGREADEARAGLRVFLRWGPATLVGIPVVVYGLSYAHFFATGHGWGEFVTLHREMFAYHRGLGTVHAYSSQWWEWPMVLRPVWYWVDERRRSGTFVFGNGNPLLWWPMVVAVVWVAIDWWGRRSLPLVILAVGFFGQWLPWALSLRGTFVYHFLPSVPFGCLALATIAVGAWRRRGWRRVAAAVYVVAVVAVFAFFYPLQTAAPMSPEQVDLRMWLGSWR